MTIKFGGDVISMRTGRAVFTHYLLGHETKSIQCSPLFQQKKVDGESFDNLARVEPLKYKFTDDLSSDWSIRTWLVLGAKTWPGFRSKYVKKNFKVVMCYLNLNYNNGK